MNGRAIPGAYLFRLYVCDKEMSWPHHIRETHQPDWVVYVRDSEKWDARQRYAASDLMTDVYQKVRDRGQLLKKRRLTLNKLWKFGRRIVKRLCIYFQFNSINCIIYFQYNSVKIGSFSFYLPFSFIQLGSCSSQPLVSFSPFVVCFLLFYKTYF
jgi:hypothetical protein